MQPVSAAGGGSAGRDRLLLSFADAKVALLDFDAEAHALRTLAAHSFEELGALVGCYESKLVPPLLRVHSGGTCAAMLVYGTQLVLLPLLGAAGLGGGGTLPPIPPLVSTAAGTAESTPACSRVDLSPLALNHVRDLAFVEGYAEPVLAVLCEPLQTWSGRLAFLSDTCTLSALQLSCRRPSCTPLWDVKGLPHDTTSILPLPNPAGGVLALSDNALLWLSPSHRCGLALNRDASVSCVPQLTPCSPSTRITLKGATAALLSTKPLVVALSLSDGHLYLVRLSTDGRGVHGIELLKVVLSVPACSMCSVASKYLFLGSMVADSLLLQLHDPLAARRLAAGAPSVERLASGLFAAKAPDAKRQKVVVKIENGAAEPMEEEEAAADVLDGAIVPTEADAAEEAAEEAALYGGKPLKQRSGGRVQVRLRDSLVSVAPIVDVSLLPDAVPDAARKAVSGGDGWVGGVNALVCGGRGKSGCLARVSRGVQLSSLFAAPMPTPCEAIFTVPWQKSSSSSGPDDGLHKYILMSSQGGSRVLEAGAELKEVTQSVGLHVSGPTLLWAPLVNATRSAQVYSSGVRWMKGIDMLNELQPPTGRAIARASSTDKYVLCVLDDGTPWLLQAEDGLLRACTLMVDAGGEGAADNTLEGAFLAASLFVDARGFFGGASSQSAPPTIEKSASSASALVQAEASASALDPLSALEDAMLYARRRRSAQEAAPPPLRAELKTTAASATLCTSIEASGRVCVWKLEEARTQSGPGISSATAGNMMEDEFLDEDAPPKIVWKLLFASATSLVRGSEVVVNERGASQPQQEDEEAEAERAKEASARMLPILDGVAEIRLLSMSASGRGGSSATHPILALYLSPEGPDVPEPELQHPLPPPKPPTLLLYRAFSPSTDGLLRFRRVAHPPSLPASVAGYPSTEETGAAAEEAMIREATGLQLKSRPPKIVQLGSFGGEGTQLDGSVLILGNDGATVLCSVRDQIWAHRMHAPAIKVPMPMSDPNKGGYLPNQWGKSVTPGPNEPYVMANPPIACAAALNMPNCANGMLLMTPSGLLHICRLAQPPANAQPTRYDSPWPLTKMTLRATAHCVTVLSEPDNTYTIAVACSSSEPLPETSLPASELDSDRGPVGNLPGAARYADAYELRLYDGESWELLDTYTLKEHEWVMTMRPMTLRHEFDPPKAPAQVSAVMNQYGGGFQQQMRMMAQQKQPEFVKTLVVGTGLVLGEDRSCTGRILVLRVSKEKKKEDKEDAADGDEEAEGAKEKKPEGDPRHFETCVAHDERAPVLTVCSLAKHGLVISGVGSKLVTLVWRENDLKNLSFYIAGFGVSALSCMQNYVIAADVNQGEQRYATTPPQQFQLQPLTLSHPLSPSHPHSLPPSQACSYSAGTPRCRPSSSYRNTSTRAPPIAASFFYMRARYTF